MLTTYSKKISVCVNCPLAKDIDSRMLCSIDGANIIDHAGRSGCPKGHFDKAPPSFPLAGDIVAAVTAKVGLDRAAKFLAKLAGRKDCGCAKRRDWLNRLDRRMRARFGR